MGARSLLVVLVLLAARPAAAERMTFRWPLPAKAVVTDRVTKQGLSATLRYNAAVTLHTDGTSLALRLTDFEFLEVTLPSDAVSVA